MFKVCMAEIRKILSKPGIYILSVLLAIILVLGVFAYQPKVYQNTNVVLTGTTFEEKYQEFVGDGISYGEKLKADTLVTDSISMVTDYNINTTNGVVNEFTYLIGTEDSQTSLLNIFNRNINAYRNCSSDSSTDSIISTQRQAVVKSLRNINTAIDEALIKSANGSYVLLTTQSNRDDYLQLYKEIYDLFDVTVEKANIASVCKNYDDNYKKEFEKILNNFNFPNITKAFVYNYTTNETGTRYSTFLARLNTITQTIEQTRTKAQTEKIDASEMDRLANQYINTCKDYSNLIKYELIANAFNYVSTTEQLNTLYLKDYSKYNSNSLLIRYNYLFENNTTENDYAHPLTIGVTSNYETNAYDYAYFVLRLFSFVIIVFATMTACHSIAGEDRNRRDS